MIDNEFRKILDKANKDLEKKFLSGTSVIKLVHARSNKIDELLKNLWIKNVNDPETALVAVGGYGRGELHPGSDIDIMILTSPIISNETKESLSKFLTSLWDIGLEIGHSVRNLDECMHEARTDLTIATTLMESRLLIGPESLFSEMQKIINSKGMWPSSIFFKEKQKEQVNRHHTHHDTAYNLEPNLKSSPRWSS